MTRPRSKCKIGFYPLCREFIPSGSWDKFECIEITAEEAESLRLKNIKNLDQTHAAKKMGISQSTFQRILAQAYKKVSEALIYGKEIKIIQPNKIK